jgi:hypothetical protein
LIATPIERSRRLVLALLLGLSLTACAEEPLPDRGLRRDDCLREVELTSLSERLRHCDAVVAAFPEDPGPRNDRSLLRSLAGDDQAACDDLREALRLAERWRAKHPGKTLDPQLRSDLTVRHQLCEAQQRPAAP